MRKQHLAELKEQGAEGACQINGDEMAECAIFDATC